LDVDPQAYKDMMQQWPSGVSVVTAIGHGRVPIGLTVSSFTSVSVDPPTVLFCLDRKNASHDPLLDSGAFAVNVLSAEQVELAQRFAEQPREARFEELEIRSEATGSPVLEGVLAWLDCGITKVYPAGDHSIVVGEALAGGSREGEALLYYRRGYGKAVT
jgi:flavin reductase (DIM6/NTAB) family NADH-FMN oxidoreductase RutF